MGYKIYGQTNGRMDTVIPIYPLKTFMWGIMKGHNNLYRNLTSTSVHTSSPRWATCIVISPGWSHAVWTTAIVGVITT